MAHVSLTLSWVMIIVVVELIVDACIVAKQKGVVFFPFRVRLYAAFFLCVLHFNYSPFPLF